MTSEMNRPHRHREKFESPPRRSRLCLPIADAVRDVLPPPAPVPRCESFICRRRIPVPTAPTCAILRFRYDGPRGYRVVGTSMTETGLSVWRSLAQLAAHRYGGLINENDKAAREASLYLSLMSDLAISPASTSGFSLLSYVPSISPADRARARCG